MSEIAALQARVNELEVLLHDVDARVSALVDNVNILRGNPEPVVAYRKRRNVTAVVEGA